MLGRFQLGLVGRNPRFQLRDQLTVIPGHLVDTGLEFCHPLRNGRPNLFQILKVGNLCQATTESGELAGIAFVAASHRIGGLGQRDEQFLHFIRLRFEVPGCVHSPLVQLDFDQFLRAFDQFSGWVGCKPTLKAL